MHVFYLDPNLRWKTPSGCPGERAYETAALILGGWQSQVRIEEYEESCSPECTKIISVFCQ